MGGNPCRNQVLHTCNNVLISMKSLTFIDTTTTTPSICSVENAILVIHHKEEFRSDCLKMLA